MTLKGEGVPGLNPPSSPSLPMPSVNMSHPCVEDHTLNIPPSLGVMTDLSFTYSFTPTSEFISNTGGFLLSDIFLIPIILITWLTVSSYLTLTSLLVSLFLLFLSLWSIFPMAARGVIFQKVNLVFLAFLCLEPSNNFQHTQKDIYPLTTFLKALCYPLLI